VSGDGSAIIGRGSGYNGDEAFRWTPGTGMVGLGNLSGGRFNSMANAVSDDGTVVVGVDVVGASILGAFRWTPSPGLMALGDLPGGVFHSNARGVSGNGAVIVGQARSAPGMEAFRWTAGGGMVGLGDLPGGSFGSRAVAASYDGSVVVGYSSSSLGSSQAFRWTAGGGMVGLGDLEGPGFMVSASDVSADGSVVVGGGTRGSYLGPVRWTAARGMESIREILLAGGVTNMEGWLLEGVDGVSADGLTMIGNGTNPEGIREAWIATIPEPSTFALGALAIAALAALAMRRRAVARA
jgi:probable HAF family extracellular repeat protein